MAERPDRESREADAREIERTGPGDDWVSEETYWRESYATRPYASADRDYDFYRPGYRYGVESALRFPGQQWEDVEPQLRRDWDRYEHRGAAKSTWQEIKDAVRDAWDRLTGRAAHPPTRSAAHAADAPAVREEASASPPGAHPTATGVGAVGGGAAGAAVGAVAGGPVGAVAGGAAGAAVGGVAGRDVAGRIDPQAEDAYWRENFTGRPYVKAGTDYTLYRPAYRYGWESRQRYRDKRWEQLESELERGWNNRAESAQLEWREARLAVRDAWDRVSGAV